MPESWGPDNNGSEDLHYVFWWAWDDARKELLKHPSTPSAEVILDGRGYHDPDSGKVNIFLFRNPLRYYLMRLVPQPNYRERLDDILVTEYSRRFAHEDTHKLLAEKFGITPKNRTEYHGLEMAVSDIERTEFDEVLDKFRDYLQLFMFPEKGFKRKKA